MPEVKLSRFCHHPEGTLGVIRLEGEEFWTVERPWDMNKPFVSCIPEGAYFMKRRDSPKFGNTWHITDVPGRTHILIHAGNYPENFSGCIGLGDSLMGDRIAVSSSRKAVSRFEALTEGRAWQMKIEFSPHAAKFP